MATRRCRRVGTALCLVLVALVALLSSFTSPRSAIQDWSRPALGGLLLSSAPAASPREASPVVSPRAVLPVLNHAASPPPSSSPPPPPPPPAPIPHVAADSHSWCPPHRTGASCERPAFPACSAMWDLATGELAACFWSWRIRPRSIPVTCACLVQCEAAGHAAVIDCVHDQPTLELPSGLNVSLHHLTPPWVGNPKELQRPWPELRVHYLPATAVRLHAAGRASRAAGLCGGRGIASSVLGDADGEVRKLLQLQAGVQAGGGAGAQAGRGCACPPGYEGDDCSPIVWHPSNCINSCSSSGRCVAGTCVCDPGASGVDCSGTAAAAGSGGRGVGEARIGAASPRIFVYPLPPELSTWLALPRLREHGCGQAAGASGAAKAPCWWQVTDPMYSADLRILNRLLTSPHRTERPEQADFFYVPLMLSIGFVTHRFGIYLPSATAARLINETVRHIQHTYPFWNRTNGADHLMPFTGDDGSTWLRGRLPELANVTFLTHWGMTCNDERLRVRANVHCVKGQLGFRSHRAGQDIVLPPLHSPHLLLPKSIWLSHAAQQPAPSPRTTIAPTSPALAIADAASPLVAPPIRDAAIASDASSNGVVSPLVWDALRSNRTYRYLLYFVGKVARAKREGDIYSGGVRQRVYAAHSARDDFYLRERPGAKGRDADLAALRQSKFCLAPHGTGFGMRQFDALLQGCVPLIIKVLWQEDGGNGGTLEQPFAEVVPWNSIAHVELTRADIPNLPAILAAFPADTHAAMRRAAACVWPRFFWMPIPTSRGRERVDQAVAPPEDGSCDAECRSEIRALERHDAFSTLLLTLGQRLRRRQRGGAEAASEEVRATAWARLEGSWSRGERRLSGAAWRTPAASCALAMSLE